MKRLFLYFGLLISFTGIVGCASNQPMEGAMPQGLAKEMGVSQDVEEFNTNYPKLRRGMTADEVDELIPLGPDGKWVIDSSTANPGVFTLTLPRVILEFSKGKLVGWGKRIY